MAINRYISQLQKTLGRQQLRNAGTKVYASSIPTKVRPADDDLIITVGDVHRLDSLASKYYGSPSLWYVIASVNNLNKGTFHVPPGTQLRIPNRSRVIG